ncbi:MAG: DUF2244 domain-containing protein [Steroidobacteraceae bacterium]
MDPACEHLDLLPNCSLSPQGARVLFAVVCVGSFAVALFVSLPGFWPVLPFAGMEMLVLAWALKISLARRWQSPHIRIDEQQICIESPHGRRADEVAVKVMFPRYWAQVKLRAAHTPLHPSRLTIESHGRACEVGQFLTEQERRSVAGRLARAIGRVSETRPLEGAPGRMFKEFH